MGLWRDSTSGKLALPLGAAFAALFLAPLAAAFRRELLQHDKITSLASESWIKVSAIPFNYKKKNKVIGDPLCLASDRVVRPSWRLSAGPGSISTVGAAAEGPVFINRDAAAAVGVVRTSPGSSCWAAEGMLPGAAVAGHLSGPLRLLQTEPPGDPLTRSRCRWILLPLISVMSRLDPENLRDASPPFGASRLATLFTVIVPLSMPGLSPAACWCSPSTLPSFANRDRRASASL